MNSTHDDSRPLRVLLVDDDVNVLNVFRSGLELHGFQVFEASSGDEAMERAGAIDGLDVMVLDINLPDGFGSSLALQLRQIHPTCGLVYMSGYARHDPILQQGIEEHMAFLNKPFSIAELAETIRKVATAE